MPSPRQTQDRLFALALALLAAQALLLGAKAILIGDHPSLLPVFRVLQFAVLGLGGLTAGWFALELVRARRREDAEQR
ncbi:MAG: hypothetical protein AAGI71_15005 [Bacteroidota bacterium]